MRYNNLFNLEPFIFGIHYKTNKNNTMKETTQSKFNIRKINNTNVLHVNEHPFECIYKGPVVLPHPQINGQMIIKGAPCSDNCPFFRLQNDGLFNKLIFDCNKTEIDVYMYQNLQVV